MAFNPNFCGLPKMTRVDRELRLLLSRTYDLKAIADYDTGPDSEISAAQATEAVNSAKRFVAHFADLLA
jgi:hypothetical protein